MSFMITFSQAFFIDKERKGNLKSTKKKNCPEVHTKLSKQNLQFMLTQVKSK